ncbi:MAG: exonuclease domain-containing protein [Clostridia bacterium]|nr:exonuclease domain-containing protein [Clostridia bacterium]
MQYVVVDLEWNNTYAKKTAGFINEIIEIGAVKLDEDFNNIDEFSYIIRSQIGRKLRGSVKRLTNLTNDDILAGLPFTKVFSLFRNWLGKIEDTVIITWGDSDIRVLLENYSYLNGIKVIPFLKNYCDLQRYYQRVNSSNPGRQTSLVDAARECGIDTEHFAHHRALDDARMTADIFEVIYDRERFPKEVLECNEEFYGRLLYKAKIIKNIDSPLVDRKRLEHRCDSCGELCKMTVPWKFSCQYFRAAFYCKNCDVTYSVRVRFKKLYDRVDYKKVVTVLDDSDTGEDEREGNEE